MKLMVFILFCATITICCHSSCLKNNISANLKHCIAQVNESMRKNSAKISNSNKNNEIKLSTFENKEKLSLDINSTDVPQRQKPENNSEIEDVDEKEKDSDDHFFIDDDQTLIPSTSSSTETAHLINDDFWFEEQNSLLKRCETFNGTRGFCQPISQCVENNPKTKQFYVCEWQDISQLNVPSKLCCPKPSEKIIPPKKKVNLVNTVETFAYNLPRNPNGKCGMKFIEKPEIVSLTDNKKKKILHKPRIVLGNQAKNGQVPWMVSIYCRDLFVCGGSLIGDRHILTAAHCFSSGRNPFDYVVRYGSVLMHNGSFAFVKQIKVHQQYRPPLIYNDIALVELRVPILFNKFVQPVCLPGKRMYDQYMIGLKAFVAGFGDLSFGGKQTHFLQEVDVKIINNTYCTDNYLRLVESERKFRYGIGETLICAGYENGGKDACQGDSGGPLTMPYGGVSYLIGIVSFGFRCAMPQYPGIYTCVAYYLDWIMTNF